MRYAPNQCYKGLTKSSFQRVIRPSHHRLCPESQHIIGNSGGRRNRASSPQIWKKPYDVFWGLVVCLRFASKIQDVYLIDYTIRGFRIDEKNNRSPQAIGLCQQGGIPISVMRDARWGGPRRPDVAFFQNKHNVTTSK